MNPHITNRRRRPLTSKQLFLSGLTLSLVVASVECFARTPSALHLLQSRQVYHRPGPPEPFNHADYDDHLTPTLLLQSKASQPTSFDLDYYDPNEIQPSTMSFRQSISYFVSYCFGMLSTHQRRQRLTKQVQRHFRRHLRDNKTVAMQARKDKPARWRRMLSKLNEQRRNLVALADYSAKIVAPSFTFLTLGALLSSLIPRYYAKCITLVATLDPDIVKVTSALVGLAATTALGAFFTGGRGSLFWIAGTRANYNIRVKLHRNILLQEAAFFDSNEVGFLLSRINNDVNKIGQVISYHVNVVTRQFAEFIFGSIFLLRISPKLALWTFGGVGLVAWISSVYGAFNRQLAQKVQDTYAKASAVSETSFSLSETVRAFNGVHVESEKFEEAQSKALKLEEVQAWGYGTHKVISDTLEAFLQGALLLACWHTGRSGGLSPESLTTFIFYARFVMESVGEMGDQWAKIQGAIGASKSVFDLIRRVPQVRDPPKLAAASPSEQTQTPSTLPHPENLMSANGAVENKVEVEVDTKPIDVVKIGEASGAVHHNGVEIEVDNSTIDVVKNGRSLVSNGHNHHHEIVLGDANDVLVNGHEQPTQQQPVIEMKDLTIKYEAMDVPAIKSVNLQIQRGDRVAVVGRSGSGKSSMLRSILRFYDPVEGTVSLNGVSLTKMSRKELSSKITVVEQEPSLFPMTLLENVLYGIDKDSTKEGKPCYSGKYRDRATNALLRAGLPIHQGNDLNLCLDTRVGEGGRSLSGGQRQRVAIARALVRRPQVLLLDEPTAALDSASEKTVVKALRTACQECQSMVMVTHRLGVVRSLNVNRVIVMERGEIVESGHPEDLLRNPNSLYSGLAREQGITSEGETAIPPPI